MASARTTLRKLAFLQRLAMLATEATLLNHLVGFMTDVGLRSHLQTGLLTVVGRREVVESEVQSGCRVREAANRYAIDTRLGD